MVYAGFCDALLDIPDPPPAKLAPDLHDEELLKTWMQDMIRRR